MTDFDVEHRNLSDKTEGIAIESLTPGTALLVRTRNSRYRFVIVDGPTHRVIVKGGTMFPEATPVRLSGATCGGSALKSGWVGVGLLMEMRVGGRRVTSSRVRSVVIGHAPPARVAA